MYVYNYYDVIDMLFILYHLRIVDLFCVYLGTYHEFVLFIKATIHYNLMFGNDNK